MLTRLVPEYDWKPGPTSKWLGGPLMALILLCGNARADVFIFNGTTYPMTGFYIPIGGGHYNYIGTPHSFQSADPTFFGLIGVEIGVFPLVRASSQKTPIPR